MNHDGKNVSLWQRIIGSELIRLSLVAMFSILLTAYFNISPDFFITVSSVKSTESSGHNIYNEITINNLHCTKSYYYPIYLEAKAINKAGIEDKNIGIEFDPEGSADGADFTSNMIIIGTQENESYKIKITAIGGDGKERNCQYVLETKL